MGLVKRTTKSNSGPAIIHKLNPEENFNYLLDIVKSRLPHGTYINSNIHPSFPGSDVRDEANEIFDLTIAPSEKAYNEGDFGTVSLKYINGMPVLATKENYNAVPGSVLPFWEQQKGINMLMPAIQRRGTASQPGSFSNILGPEDVIASILRYGVTGSSSSQSNETVQDRINEAIWSGHKTTNAFGQEYTVPPLKMSSRTETSNATINMLSNSVILAPQTVQRTSGIKPPFGEPEQAILRIQELANSGRVGGLPIDGPWAIDRTGNIPLLINPGIVGTKNPHTGLFVSPVEDPFSNVKINARDINSLWSVGGGRATTLDNPAYHPVSGVLRAGEQPPTQLHMRGFITLDEFSEQSGMGSWALPGKNKSGTRVMAGYRTEEAMRIYNINRPQDLFSQDAEGNWNFKVQLDKRFLPETLQKKNLLGANRRVNVASVQGTEGNESLSFLTGQRQFAITGTAMYIPEAWMHDPTNAQFINDVLIPQAQKQGMRVETRPMTTVRDTGYSPYIGIEMVGLESPAAKGGPAIKITNTPIDPRYLGVSQVDANGNLRMGMRADLVAPGKNPFLLMEQAFYGASREQQINILRDTMGKSGRAEFRQMQKYLSGIGDNPVNMEQLASIAGTDTWSLIGMMKDRIIGTGRLYQNGVIDEAAMAQEAQKLSKYGLRRMVGWTAFDTFTEETKNLFINKQVSTILDNPNNTMSEEQIRSTLSRGFRFQQTANVGGQPIYTGYEMKEGIFVNNLPTNFVVEYGGGYKDKYNNLSESLSTGYPEIADYLRANPAKRNVTEEALLDMFMSRADTISGRGIENRYIKVSNDQTNIKEGWLNRKALQQLMEANAQKYSSKSEAYIQTRKEINKLFGGDRGIRMELGEGEKDIFLPKLATTEILDELGIQIADNGMVEGMSVGRLLDKSFDVLSSLASGDERSFAKTRETWMDIQNKYGRRIEEVSTGGVHIKTSASSLVAPGQMFVSDDLLYRAGVGRNEEGVTIATNTREPQPASGSIAIENGQVVYNPGSTAVNTVKTQRSNSVFGYLEHIMKKTGFATPPAIFSPLNVSKQQDFDADPEQIKFLNATNILTMKLGRTPTALEIKDYQRKIESMQSPEAQERSMRQMYKGSNRYSFDPLSSNIFASFATHADTNIYGEPTKSGLLSKPLITNMGANFERIVNLTNEAKKKEMARTHNQLIRRLETAGYSLGYPQAFTQTATDETGKYIQGAIDKKMLEDDQLTRILSAGYMYVNDKTGNINIAYHNKENESVTLGHLGGNNPTINDFIGDAMNSLIKNQPSLTSENLASLFWQNPYRTDPSLTLEENNKISAKALVERQKVVEQIEKARGGSFDERTSIIQGMVSKGVIGRNSLFGEAITGRMYEYLSGKEASVYPDDRAMAETIKAQGNAILGGSEFDKWIRSGIAPSSMFTLAKGGKNYQLPIELFNPGAFMEAAASWMINGSYKTQRVQNIMGTLGEALGIRYQTDKTGMYVMSDATMVPVRTWSDVRKYQQAIGYQSPGNKQLSRGEIEIKDLQAQANDLTDKTGTILPGKEKQFQKLNLEIEKKRAELGLNRGGEGTFESNNPTVMMGSAEVAPGVRVAFGGANPPPPTPPGPPTTPPPTPDDTPPPSKSWKRPYGKYQEYPMSYEAHMEVGKEFLKNFNSLFGVEADANGDPVRGMDPLLFAYGKHEEGLLAGYRRDVGKLGREGANFRLQQNPATRKILQTLASMRANAENIEEFIPEGKGSEGATLLGKAFQGDLAAQNELKNKYGQDVWEVFRLAEEGISGKIPSSIPEDMAYHAYTGTINRERVALSSAKIRHLLTGSMSSDREVREQAIRLERAEAEQKLGVVAKSEAELGIPENRRTGIHDTSTEIMLKKNAILMSKSMAPIYAENTLNQWTEPALKGIMAAEEQQAYLEGPEYRGKEAKEAIDTIQNSKQIKFYDALAELTKKLDQGSISLEEFHKNVKKTNEEFAKSESANVHIQKIIKADQIRETFGKQGVKFISQEGEELTLSDQIKVNQKGQAGIDATKGYYELQKQETKALMQMKESGIGAQMARAARGIFGGFGLMYMRSIGNIIASGGEFGYQESVQNQTAVTQAMGGAYGLGGGGMYTMQDQIAGAKALYSGGGKRFLNSTYNDILRTQPGLINAGQGLISGLGTYAASAWLGGQLGISALGGPLGIAIGAAVGVGTMAINQIGAETDESTWLAKNYQAMVGAKGANGFNMTNDQRQFMNSTLFPTIAYKLGESFVGNIFKATFQNDKAVEFRSQFEENRRLGKTMASAQEMVNNGSATSIKNALAMMNVSDDDQYRIEKAFATGFVTANTPGITNASKLTAVQQYTGWGGDVNNTSTLTQLAKIADLGLDLATPVNALIKASGNQYSADRYKIAQGILGAYPNMTATDYSKLTTVASLAEQMGPGWTQANFGKTPEEIQAYFSPKRTPITSRKVGGAGAAEAIDETTAGVNPELDRIANALVGPNQELASQYLGAADIFRKLGTTLLPGTGIMPEEFTKTMTLQQKADWNYRNNFALGVGSAITNMQKSFGMNVAPMARAAQSLYTGGTQAQINQFAALMANPTNPMLIGSYTQNWTSAQKNAYNNSSVNTWGGAVPGWLSSFTGATQEGVINGLNYGAASLATPTMTAQQMATQIWGPSWASNGGMAQGAINAMVNGFQYNGKTYFGQQGLDFQQNKDQYQMAMAQAGIQMRGIALQGAFTTGVGLGAYAGTVDPRTGKPFGINVGSGGFWGLEDQSIALSRRQQEWQFEQQEQQMNMQNRFWQQDRSMQRKSMTMQRSYAREDWAYQENVRDLQWGWKQEDFQENIRFMTGRERRLAERQMGRETTMHDIEGDRIEVQKKRQKEQWNFEDQRFAIEKKQHDESLNFQREEMKQSQEFWRESKKIEDEQQKLQRAYWVEQQKLQKESAGLSAAAAQKQYDLNNKMSEYKAWLETTQGKQVLLNTDLANFAKVLGLISDTVKNLSSAGSQNSTVIPGGGMSVFNWGGKSYRYGSLDGVNYHLYLDGKEIVGAFETQLINAMNRGL